ncbi:hypothetical protein AOQ84DRAFT_414346 [Glonium stellatum]|uniref:DUF7580 domain-containing protein n=1 Tax=Glonium stellatum TaxID=574774 RepID=A0A8E2FAH1_9PEZI|nr:hypothetical protein AOQ84DRAFT_414346 [Glonium stellatum]
MSGIEITGLVLGAFPIILNCLDYYREGCEPLKEWWTFRTQFIEFVDEIRHEMMRYNENMVRLLDPIVTDNDSLTTLVRNVKDPRWTDGSLTTALKERLASEYDRFLRIVERMMEVVEDLKKLLQIKDGDAHWVVLKEQRPWEWHLKRIQISFSKGKNRKVRKLASHNTELQDILGYSERVIPIADTRKTSPPIALFEKIRQHASTLHSALSCHWKCSSRNCSSHQAHLNLRGETNIINLSLLFIIKDKNEPSSKSVKQEVIIRPTEGNTTVPPAITPQISHVQQAASFTAMQKHFQDAGTTKKEPRFGRFVPKIFKNKTLASGSSRSNATTPVQSQKQAHFAMQAPTITVSQHSQVQKLPDITICSSNPSFPRIVDLCSSLRTCRDSNFGVIVDGFGREFLLSKSTEGHPEKVLNTVRLVPLPNLLDAYHNFGIEIDRQHRFKIALHIASALLQIHMTPWLPTGWSKRDLYFLADSHTVHSDHPYVRQTFASKTIRSPAQTKNSLKDDPSLRSKEEDTRASLFTVGVILLELIFGQNIESCSFRKDYYGPDGQPNDQTDISTARKWAQKVLGECGVHISDVVRRCLDCSFGPRPSLNDKRFREAVYEGVIKPLADYSKTWQEVEQ